MAEGGSDSSGGLFSNLADFRKEVIDILTGYLGGLIAGLVVGIADIVESGFNAVEGSLVAGGESFIATFAPVGDLLLGINDMLSGMLRSLAAAAGPFGPIVWPVVVVVVLVILWRLGRAVMDSVPILSGVQTLLESDRR